MGSKENVVSIAVDAAYRDKDKTVVLTFNKGKILEHKELGIGVNHDLPRSEKIELLQAWEKSWNAIKSSEMILNQVMDFSFSTFMNEIGDMFILYTDTVGRIIGDQEQWMKWYAFECKMGNDPREVVFKNGITLVVSTIEDLLVAIEKA